LILCQVLGPHLPFGGVKETGGSSDLGLQALRNYTHTHVVVAKL
jgi:acyl-CoA reductase-like NAD-dependent aldehyde dehydrogenase